MFGSGELVTSNKKTFKPKLKKLPFKLSPLEIFSKFHKNYDNAYLLESVEGPKKLARYSFIGFSPSLNLTVKDGQIAIRDERTGEKVKEKTEDPLLIIQSIIEGRKVSDMTLRLAGGAVGFISYDAIRYWENLGNHTKDDLSFPDVRLGFFDDGIFFDHTVKKGFYYYIGENRLSEITRLMKRDFDFEPLSYRQPKINVKKHYFEKSVEEAKEYVATGDVFQVVLSKRFDFGISGDLIGFYRSLRRINPSPYMYFLKTGDRQIVGSSPEMLVRVENRVVETYPIVGTRPCVKDPIENKRLAEELLADPKERAEHVMLVDLARNDIGKVSKFGSIRLPEFMTVHKYSHVPYR
jgi:anthranilate synthase component 1